LHDAIRSMLDRYECRSRDDYVNALREILQDLALLGLWRSKFFEHAAFYGGTALRVLHGLDRYSEDLDFSLLKPNASFSLGAYGEALQREISSFGFRVTFTQGRKKQTSAIDSAFLKADTYSQLIEIEAREELLRNLPDLFAGKLHAVLCRKWKTRVKGRDWYDLVWYAGHHPEVRLSHLEARMRQSGDYRERDPMTPSTLQDRLLGAVDSLDVAKARQEVAPFVRDPRVLDIWSADFFRRITDRIVPI